MTKKLRKEECKLEDSLIHRNIEASLRNSNILFQNKERKKKGQKIKIIIFIWNKIQIFTIEIYMTFGHYIASEAFNHTEYRHPHFLLYINFGGIMTFNYNLRT